MKTLHKTLIALAAGALLTTGAQANYSNISSVMTGQSYVGAKAGQFDTEPYKSKDADKPVAYGLYAGYDFGGGLGAEVDYTMSSDADFSDVSDEKGEFNASTLGAYGVYRYSVPNSKIFAKGKLGYAQSKIKANDDKMDDTGFAGGVGVGMKVSNNLTIEGEYTMLPTIKTDNSEVDTDLMSIGAHFSF